tara:strand:- start:40674 stop:41078 length:405 start_codon:yes stop_codon:yes gene_type:complete
MRNYDITLATESNQYTGTFDWHAHWLNIRLTDGVVWLRQQLSCSWLIDEIAMHIKKHRQAFMVAKFRAPKQGSGVMVLEDGNTNVLETINYCETDLCIDNVSFDESRNKQPEITIFLAYDNYFKTHVAMLPTEY